MTQNLSPPRPGTWLLDSSYVPQLERVFKDPQYLADLAGQRQAADPRGRTKGQGNNIGVVALMGVVEHRLSLWGWLMGGTGLDVFGMQIDALANDPSVGQILILVDSPGGSATGTPEAAMKVKAASQRKRVVAVVDGMAASAAYWIASQASEVVASPSSDVGSIGVYSVHVSYEAALAKDGIKVSIIRQPAMKAGGNPYEDLQPAVRDVLQQQTDQWYADFLSAVASGRKTTRATVKEKYGQGLTMLAKDALKAGMVDRVATVDQTVSSMLDRASAGRAEQQRRRRMQQQRRRETTRLHWEQYT